MIIRAISSLAAWSWQRRLLLAGSAIGLAVLVLMGVLVLSSSLAGTHFRKATLCCLAWNPDGTVLAASYGDGSVDLLTYDGQGWVSARRLKLAFSNSERRGGPFTSLVWSPDGKMLAGNHGYVTYVYKVSDGTELLSLYELRFSNLMHPYLIVSCGTGIQHYDNHLAWSPDSLRLAIMGCITDDIAIWEVGSVQPVPVWGKDVGAKPPKVADLDKEKIMYYLSGNAKAYAASGDPGLKPSYASVTYGPDNPEPLASSPMAFQSITWTADGKRLLIVPNLGMKAWCGISTFCPEKRRWMSISSTFDCEHVVPSPDGRRLLIAYHRRIVNPSNLYDYKAEAEFTIRTADALDEPLTPENVKVPYVIHYGKRGSYGTVDPGAVTPVYTWSPAGNRVACTMVVADPDSDWPMEGLESKVMIWDAPSCALQTSIVTTYREKFYELRYDLSIAFGAAALSIHPQLDKVAEGENIRVKRFDSVELFSMVRVKPVRRAVP